MFSSLARGGPAVRNSEKPLFVKVKTPVQAVFTRGDLASTGS